MVVIGPADTITPPSATMPEKAKISTRSSTPTHGDAGSLNLGGVHLPAPSPSARDGRADKADHDPLTLASDFRKVERKTEIPMKRGGDDEYRPGGARTPPAALIAVRLASRVVQSSRMNVTSMFT